MKDDLYMKRALELAALGQRSASPNPLVGCVIVYNNEIIGEGWHKDFGGPHAEVNAVNSVSDKALLVDSTIYVTLEPCSYHGKTPACTDLISEVSPKRVVVASKDPNPKVSGQGMAILKDKGIELCFGVLEKEAVALNKRFFISMNLNRPYILLKWAQTSDGYLARSNYDSKWISNKISRQLVHKWRSEEDAILIGYNTAKYDNPRLNVREWQGSDPVKIVIDPKNELDGKLRLFNGHGKTIVLNTVKDSINGDVLKKRMDPDNFFSDVMDYLNTEAIGSVLVEGGAKTLLELIGLGLWDEARVFIAEKKFNQGIKAPSIKFEASHEQMIDNDRLLFIYNPETKKTWQKN